MKLYAHQQARSSDATAPLRWLSLFALAGLGSAAAKQTTDIDTSTLLIPSISTASGDYIHASVVSVADGDAGLTTLTLQCVNGGSSACAQTAFAGKTYIYGPATASVALDHTWSCAVSTSASSSAVCAYSDSTPAVTASTATVTGAAWHTAVTITSGVDKLRAKQTKTTATNAGSPTDSSNSGLCKRVTKGNGAGGDDAGADSVGSTTPKSGSGTNTDDDADDSSNSGSGSGSTTTNKDPCSGASSRWGLGNTSLMGTVAVISGLGLVILGL